MSDTPANPVPPESPESKPAKPARWPKWRKRLWRGFLITLTLALVVRVVLFFAIGPVMRKVAGIYGFDVTFQRQEITLLGGDVGLWYLKVTPQSGGEPIFQADYIRGSISTLELMKGRLFVQRAEADGVGLVVERTADGRIPVLDQVIAATTSTTKPSSAAAPAAEQNLDFTPPLKVEAFRLQHVRATIRDASVKPALQATLAMDVRVSSLGEHDRPMLFDVDIWSDAILDSMRITGQASSLARAISASATVTMRGLHPGPLAGYLAPFGIKPIASSLSADLAASLKTEALADSNAGVKAVVTLDRIRVTADERDAAALAKLEIQADKVTSTATTIGNISIHGGRLFASRSSDGLLRAFGFELGAAPSSASTQPTAAPTTPVVATAAPYALTIKQATITDAAMALSDYSVSPVNEFRASIPRLAIEGQAIDPSNLNTVIPIAGEVSLPGIAANAKVSGSVKPFASVKSLQLRFDAAGIKPDALKPYLAPLGVESLLENATAQGQLDATLQMAGPTIDLLVSQLKLADGEELIGLGSAKIVGAGIDAQSGRTKVASVDISGPSIDIARDSTGRLTVSKMRWDPTKMQTASKTPTPAAPTTAPAQFNLASLPKLEIGSFTWKGMKLRLRDEQVEPPSSIAIDDAGVELKDFVFDLSAKAATKPGSIRSWISSPELAKQASIEGTFSTGDNAFGADVKVRSEGLQTAILAPYLKSLGITPTLRAGSLQADAKLSIAQTSAGLTAAIDASGVSFKDSDVELGGVDSFQLKDLTLNSSGIDIKSIQIARPRSAVALEADNAITAMGIRVLLPQAPPARVALTTQPSTAPTQLVLPSIALHELRITDGALGWTDRGFANPVQTTGHATIDLSDLVLGSSQPSPAKFRSVVSAAGVLDEMVVEGTFDPNPAALAFQARVTGKGLRAGALASYLPAGIEIATRDGQLRATIDAGLKVNPLGGSDARLAITDVDWRDGTAANAPLFAMQSLRVTAPRIDLPGNIIAINEISARGVEADISMGSDGALIAAGARVGGKPSPDIAPNPSVRPPPPGPSTQPGEDVAALIADARRPLPLVTLKTLDLNLLRASLRDSSRPGAAPLIAENVRVHNAAPIELAGENAASRPPVRIEVEGKLLPITQRFTANLSIAPFAQEPSATIDVSSHGISGQSITDMVPELKEFLSGASLTDGQFKTKIESHIKFDRKSPRDFDLSRGFVLDLAVEGTEFRGSAGGPVLAGLESLRLEQAKIDPRTGSVLAKSLEITKPSAAIYRDKDGLHALGLLAPLDRYLSPTTAPTTAGAGSAAPAPAAVAGATAATKPTSEIRIDRLTLNGLDLRIEDRTVSPTFVAPLNGLDVEVRDLTTMALYEPRAIRFSAIVNADKVPLPSSGKSSTTRQSSASTQPATRPMEEREFFSQIVSTGRLSLYPKPAGYAKTSINGVELAAFEGLATLAGVQLHGGSFDGTFDLRFREDGTLDSRSKLVITDLQYAESPGGPLSKAFASPADVIITAVEAPDKSITIPLNVSIKNGELTGGQIAGAALGAASSVIVTAIASAPVKLASGVTDFVGIGGFFKRKVVVPSPLVLQYAPGSTYLDPPIRAQLEVMIEFLRKNKNSSLKIVHELGQEDLPVADSRANLTGDDALTMAAQLRQHKAALSQERARLASELRAQLVFASPSEREKAVMNLRSLDQQIGDTETAMDSTFDLLRPGADRQASRRARAVVLSIAQRRIDGMLSELRSLATGLDFETRILKPTPLYNPSEQLSGGQITISISGAAKK